MPYSIFIIPPEPIFTKLKKIIKNLAQEFNGPVFDPHLTLIGNINVDLPELEQKVKKLASLIDNLEINLGDASFSTTYYQNVFIRVLSTEKLMQLNIEGRKLLGMSSDVFMPHISVLYGNQDMSARERAAIGVNPPKGSFDAKELCIVPATEDINKWVPVARVPLRVKS